MSFLNRALRLGEGKQFKSYEQRVARIAAFEEEMSLYEDAEMREAADALRERALGGESLDDLLPETFALVREAGKRTMGMRHFDVQLIGGMVLHDGAIAEMKTGEGKTLTATLALILNSLPGDGVHLITANDYLARRDALWMKPIYDLLGVSIGIIQNMQPVEDKAAAYSADITFGTNSEFGFDYLRDNMAKTLAEKVQHGGRPREEEGKQNYHRFAVVDEVDNILIDEARTPLIISGAPEQAADLYAKFARLAPQMEIGKTPEGLDPKTKKEFIADFDFETDEKYKAVSVTERGVNKAERFMGIDHLYRAENGHLVNHLIQALKAESLYQRGVDYEVIEDQVMIIDEHTGRIMEGRRWSEGLHQAVEAKEGVRVQEENDGHGAHRGDRVHEDLRPPGRRDPHQPQDGARRPERPGLQDQGRQMVGGRAGDRYPSRDRSAGAGRDDLGRGLRDAVRAAAPPRNPALRAQRQARVRRTRGRDDRRGRRTRRGDDRHQHGGPWRRHQARR
jgi:preprotein translocase subunit SecA